MEHAASSFLTNPKAHFLRFPQPKPSTPPWPSYALTPRRKSCRHRLQRNLQNKARKCIRAAFTRAPDPHQPATVSAVDEIRSALLACVQKPLTLAFFCLAVGSAPFFLPSPARAIVDSPLTVWASNARKGRRGRGSRPANEYDFSSYTENLLNLVSVLLSRINMVKSGRESMKAVREALEDVKAERKEALKEIIRSLNLKLRVLSMEKSNLVSQLPPVARMERAAIRELDEFRELDRPLLEKEKAQIESLRRTFENAKEVYSQLEDKIHAIDEEMLRKKTMTYSIAFREVSFIVDESKRLVESLEGWLENNATATQSQEQMSTRLSKVAIQKELQRARRDYLEQIILPKVVKVEDSELFADEATRSFILNVKQALVESRDLQRDLEARIKRSLKRDGDGKRVFVRTPEDEAVKGYPTAELKWMFGQKEVIVPNAVRLQLLHGWRKWRENANAKLKEELTENPDRDREYISKRKESILIDRDRLMSKTWYNEERKRWEMDPVAVPFAVSKKLVKHARIRHDWAVMYLSLKGDDREYFIDIKDFDRLFEEFGGFDGLYTKLLASGTTTSVHFMWIPFFEMFPHQQIMLILKLLYIPVVALWKSWVMCYVRGRIFSWVKEVIDDIMAKIVFPTVEFIVPHPVRMKLGIGWPEAADDDRGPSWYLVWQAWAEASHRSRFRRTIKWHLSFLIRCAAFGYILFQAFLFMRRTIRRLSPFGSYQIDSNSWKLRGLRAWRKCLKKHPRTRRELPDRIQSAFDEMKRVKNPPIRLNDFANVESMREEINEIVRFLQNPAAFKEMGARAPKGVLIVGESGTGKTSLAMAIAAEAKVPVVEVKAQQLEESGLMVGQSAVNVREFFQTARDLAPVIIFVEDFDQFAGVRGKFVNTEQHDHEAFINQLLVELDGFEKQDGVVLLATTKNPRQIDKALIRPGRMDRMLHLRRPTQLEREKILRTAAEETMDEYLIDFVDWRMVAEKTALFWPADLKLTPLALEGSAFRNKFLDADELMSFCGWFATFSSCIPNWFRRVPPVKKISRWLVNHLGLTLTREDLELVVNLMDPYGQISNGIELHTPPRDWTRETKFPHAVWAAGRALIALLLPNFDIIDHIWLEPSSWEGIGCTKLTKFKGEGTSNGNVETRSYLEKRLVFCFGSYIASEMLLPLREENLLSGSELKQAQKIATQMVIQYGWGPDDSPTVYFCKHAVSTLSMGDNCELEMAAKVEKIYNLAYDRAKHMLLRNRRVLERVVHELLEFENLSRKDLLKILDDYGGIQEKEPFFLTARHMQPIASRFLGDGNGSGFSLARAS